MLTISYAIDHLIIMLFSASLGTELCEQTNHIFHISITNHMSKTLFIYLFIIIICFHCGHFWIVEGRDLKRMVSVCCVMETWYIVDKNCVLLGYYATSIGNSLLTFRNNLSVSSSEGQESMKSRSLDSCPLKVGPIACPETSVAK
jgi:hypothetical protein